MRVLIIDGSRLFMEALRHALARALPEVEVSVYDPEQRGLPAADFVWAAYDFLFLSSDLPGPVSGLHWLRRVRGSAAFPPVALLIPPGGGEEEGEAARLGVHAVLHKGSLKTAELAAIIRAATADTGDRVAPGFDERTAEIDGRILRRAMGAPEADTRALEDGYRFVRLIGQGAMTRVYLAERVGHAAAVVLKILDTELARDSVLVDRFAQEAELVSRLRSPYVVRILDHGFTNAYGFIAMEFFPRGDLKQHIEAGVTPFDALLFALNTAYGLKAIHALGIVHRDLKPANIMFRADGSLALADFGVSKRLGVDLRLTRAGELLGTPHYMAPEQFQSHPVDHRADLYSLGVILHELLVGRKPFDGATLSAIAYQQMRGEVPRLPRRLGVFQEVLEGLLAKEPGQRHADAAAVITALEGLVTQLDAPAVPSFSGEETVELVAPDEQTVRLPEGYRSLLP